MGLFDSEVFDFLVVVAPSETAEHLELRVTLKHTRIHTQFIHR